MLTLAFTHFQVMPEFLDFLFPFGKQESAQDLYCSGFREQTRLSCPATELEIKDIGWSGRGLQLCYSLKSVEKSTSQDWPWSIRHCALHHAFDVENTRSTWIVIKGNREIELRIQSATSSKGPAELSSFQTIDRAFAAALATHLILCDWSVENWRWYIKFLEEKLRQLTQGAMSIDADIPLCPISRSDTLAMSPRAQVQSSQLSRMTRRSTLSSLIRFQAQTTDLMTVPDDKKSSVLNMYTNSNGLKQPLPPGIEMDRLQVSKAQAHPFETFGQQQFSFGDLQETQHIEEKANETVLILELNLNVISQLRSYYQSIFESQKISKEINLKCKDDMVCFRRRIDGIENDIKLQLIRVNALLRLLADRKDLLRGLLDFRNMQVNKLLATQSQNSTKNMEHMTHDMNEIARKTKTETTSMKIITLVTLFFLPGTFISVSRLNVLMINFLECQFQPTITHARTSCAYNH